MRALIAPTAGALLATAALSSPWLRGSFDVTFVLVPLGALLLVGVGRALGARAVAPAERLLWIGWLALALGGSRLGLPGWRPIVVAALALLLALRVARLLPALARRCAVRDGRWSTWPFAAVPLAAGLALLPWLHSVHEPNGDEPYFLLLAESLVSDGDFDLADEYRDGTAARFTAREVGPQPGDWEGPDGQRRSRHESLLVFYAAPFWLAGGGAGVRFGMLLIWALFAERVLALLRTAGVSPRGALRAWVAATFTSPAVVFAAQVWAELAAALALAIALERWFRLRAAPRDVVRLEADFAIALAALPLLKLRFFLLALPLALGFLLERRRRRAGWFVFSALVGVVAILFWRNDLLVGRALGIYRASDFVPATSRLGDYLRAFGGLFFDLAFGLFATAPIWLVSLAGLSALAARRGIAAIALAASLPYLAAVSSMSIWFGGWSPPFRYGVVLLPVAALALGHALDRPPRRAERWLHAALAQTSALLVLAYTVEPGWAISFADGRSRVSDLLAAPFVADFVRLLPSALRPRPASWIVPALALATLWLARRDRSRRMPAPSAAAAATILALFAGALFAAHRVPTRVAEVEDPWIARGVGELDPPLWTVDRTNEPGGLSLGPGDPPREIAPVAGGARVAIRIAFRAKPGNRASAVLVVGDASGNQLVRQRVLPGPVWQVVTLPERSWPRAERLWLAVEAWRNDAEGLAAAVVVDRVEFDWR